MRGDQCLLEGVRRGELQDFTVLVRRYYRPLHLLCTRMLGDSQRAEDVVQESLIKTYRSIDSLKDTGKFKSWLYRITINTARNELRLKREEPMDIEDRLLDPSGAVDDELSNKKISQMLRSIVQTLPKKQKQALCLRIYDDLSFREVAMIMSCPYDTAKANYRHALLKIKEVLLRESLSEKDLRQDQTFE